MALGISSLFKKKISIGALCLSLLTILSLLLSACGNANSNASKGAGPKTLTIVNSPNGDFPQAFSPFSASPNPGVQGMVYETLLYFNQLKPGQITPWLASSYSETTDAKSIVFHLRPGVKWSDGKALTSADVVFTVDTLKKYSAADSHGIAAEIASITAPDTSTVNVTLTKSDSSFLWYFAGQTYIIPQHIFASVGDPTKYPNANPIGTGPYMLDNFTPQLIKYKRNPNYWQPGKAQVAELLYPAFDSNTSVELSLDRGNLDWTGIYTPNIGQTFKSKDSSHNNYWFSDANVVTMYLNLTKAPFNQVAVRQAISLAVDRQKMSQIGESGYETPASPTGLVPAFNSYLSPSYQNQTASQDMAKAAQLMSSAGLKKDSKGIYVGPDGKELSFKLIVPTGWTDWVSDCNIFADNMKSLGINVAVTPIAEASYYGDLQTGSYDMALSWTASGPTPFYYYNGILNSKNTAAIGQTANSNWSRWKDNQSDQYLNTIANTTDQAAQKQAIQGLEKISVEQLPTIPLLYGAYWYEYTTSHFTGWPSPNNPYAVPSPYTGPDCEVVVLNLKPVQ